MYYNENYDTRLNYIIPKIIMYYLYERAKRKPCV